MDVKTQDRQNQDNYFITIKRGLLEDKHRYAMQINQKTTAVWLYIWLIDKITSINADTKMGIVLGGKPLKIDSLAKELHTSRNTANKMLQALKNHGYIETVRTPHGNIIYVTKAFKIFGQKIPSDNKLQFVESYGAEHNTVSPKSNTSQQESNTSHQQANTRNSKNLIRHKKQGLPLKESNTSNIRQDSNKTSIATSNSTDVELLRERISKTYYEAIKALDLPVRNHNTVKSKITELSKTPDPDAIIKYLEFIRDQYLRTNWNYKPHLNEALDIFAKRTQIKNTLERHIQESSETQPRKFGSRK